MGHISPTPEYEFETIMFEIKVGFFGFVCLFFWPFHKIDVLICHLAFLQHFLCNLFLSVSSFDLGENQKRWVVIGICLNRLLLPVLRDFVGQEIPKHYTSLKSTHGIDTQVSGSHLARDKKIKLNYKNINNNWRKKKSPYNYGMYIYGM